MLEGYVTMVDLALSPLFIFKPHLVILILAFVLTFFISILNFFVTDRKVMNEIRKKLVEIKEKITLAQKEGNMEKVNEFLTELMKVNKQYLKINLKSTLISFGIFLFFVPWFYYKFGKTAVVNLPFSLPILGSSLNWVIWYFLVSFTTAWLVRKLMGE
jgi:uncharacterized membrane protein (DUF106 family)